MFSGDDDMGLNVIICRADILGTNVQWRQFTVLNIQKEDMFGSANLLHA